MKKTVIVNINGIIFHIDEDAFGKLNAYIDALHRYFDAQTEGREIVSDIESRIAELLQPRINETKQSVTIEDIEDIIITLGQPEDIAGTDDIPPFNESYNQEQGFHESRKYNRHLYRDPDNKIIGGVCSGLAAYFGVDVVIIRIAFIALLFLGGISLLLYFILWPAVPMAYTAAQKLEMHGKEVTINNIEQTYHRVGEANRHSIWSSISYFINGIFSLLGHIFFAVWRIFVFVSGICLIIVSITLIVTLLGAVFFNNFFWHEMSRNMPFSFTDFLNIIVNPVDTALLVIVLLAIFIIPLIGVLYGGLKILIRFKAKDKWVILSLSILWIIAVILGMVLVFKQLNNFKYTGTSRELVTLSSPRGKVIYLQSSNSFDSNQEFVFQLFDQHLYGINFTNQGREIYESVKIDIEESSSAFPQLEIIRSARGTSNEEALDMAREIKVKYTQTDSVLNIEPIFRILESKPWKFQSARIVLHVPVGMKIHIDENTRNFLQRIKNVNDYWKDDMVGKSWQMTENGLELVRFIKNETTVLKKSDDKILYIQLRDRFSNLGDKLQNHDFGHVELDGKTFNCRVIDFDIKRSETKQMTIQVQKKTVGIDQTSAQNVSQTILYSFEQKDSILWLDPAFIFPQDIRQNDQEVMITLNLPIDTRIFLSEDMSPLIGRFAEKRNKDRNDLVNKELKMTFDGLKEIEEKNSGNQ
jgi:phage shock protein PspC (stress-responsive transcriptional regulator)